MFQKLNVVVNVSPQQSGRTRTKLLVRRVAYMAKNTRSLQLRNEFKLSIIGAAGCARRKTATSTLRKDFKKRASTRALFRADKARFALK